jgi:hypothetical protein
MPQGPSAPAKGPNVLTFMTDDVGFVASSTFGGGIGHATGSSLTGDGSGRLEFTGSTDPSNSPSRPGAEIGTILRLASGRRWRALYPECMARTSQSIAAGDNREDIRCSGAAKNRIGPALKIESLLAARSRWRTAGA